MKIISIIIIHTKIFSTGNINKGDMENLQFLNLLDFFFVTAQTNNFLQFTMEFKSMCGIIHLQLHLKKNFTLGRFMFYHVWYVVNILLFNNSFKFSNFFFK